MHVQRQNELRLLLFPCYAEFAGNVAAVYTHPLMHTPSASGSHYGGDAETYMNIGEAMGTAMAKMLKADNNKD